MTIGVGAVAGFLAGLAQTGGPPVVAYWLGRDLPGAVARANLILYFALSSLLTATSYLVAGLFTPEVLGLVLVAAPPYGLGMWAGSRLFGRASEAAFRRLCYALIAAAALLGAPILDRLVR